MEGLIFRILPWSEMSSVSSPHPPNGRRTRKARESLVACWEWCEEIDDISD